jgi:hypothetical protein
MLVASGCEKGEPLVVSPPFATALIVNDISRARYQQSCRPRPKTLAPLWPSLLEFGSAPYFSDQGEAQCIRSPPALTGF